MQTDQISQISQISVATGVCYVSDDNTLVIQKIALFSDQVYFLLLIVQQFYLSKQIHHNRLLKMAEAQADRLVQKACSLIKKEDIVHRGFLKPIQITLKTYKTEQLDQTSKLSPNSSPAGLKIAMKSLEDNDVYLYQNIGEIHPNETFSELRENSKDNMLALMKQTEGIELAICICMCKEDKKTLKNTLAAVEQNIENLVALEGIDPDKIGVFVMVDGIQKIDKSIVDFFEELQMSSNIYLGSNLAPSLSASEIAEKVLKRGKTEANTDQLRNVSNFIFDCVELEERNSMRFEAKWEEFMEKIDLMETVEKLKSKKPFYYGLPTSLQELFLEEARRMKQMDSGVTDQEIKRVPQDEIIADYTSDLKKTRPVFSRVLWKCENACKRFLTAREDMAYLGYFRRKVLYSQQHIQDSDFDPNNSLSQVNYDGEITREPPFTYMNLFLCVKYKNNGKLSSHNWFFNGFCKQLKPKYTVLLDVGVKPEEQSLMKMYNYLRYNKSIGGVCGYMNVVISRLNEQEKVKSQEIDCLTSLFTIFVDIRRTQQVQYHFTHLIDKPFQASFGYIQMLPSAFSAYNMNAILSYQQEEKDQLLRSYFQSIEEKISYRKKLSVGSGTKNLIRAAITEMYNGFCVTVDPASDQAILYNENIYLAEDRVLSIGIHKKGYDMAYLPDARANVDPIPTVHGLLGQRKRWINGSYFAFEKVKLQLSHHEKKVGLQCGLTVQFIYLTLTNTLSYFAPSLFLFAVHISLQAFREDVLVLVLQGVVNDPNTSQFYNAFVYTMDFIYVMLLLLLVIYTLHLAKNQKSFMTYIYTVSTLLGMFMIVVVAVFIVDIVRGLIFDETYLITNSQIVEDIPGGIVLVNIMRWIEIGLAACFVVPVLFYMFFYCRMGNLFDLLLGGLSYIFYWPTYLNILNIYSLCRIDEVSWGVKGLDPDSHLRSSWKLIKCIHVVKYVIWNFILSIILLTLGSRYLLRFFTYLVIVTFVTFAMLFKVIMGILYLIFYRCLNSNILPNTPVISSDSRINKLIDRYQPEIMKEIKDHLNEIKQQYMGMTFLGTFLQAARTKKNVDEAKKRHQEIHMKKSGSIERNFLRKNMSSFELKPTTSDIRHDQIKRQPKIKDDVEKGIGAFIISEMNEGGLSRTEKQMLQKEANIFYQGRERGPQIRKPKK